MASKYEFAIVGNDKTKRMFKSINAGLGSVRRGINSTQAKMVVLAGAAGLGALVARSLQVNDSLAKTADRLDTTTEGLAALRHMTQLAGESTETMDKALAKMRRTVGEAAQGTGEGMAALKLMNIEIKDILGLKADEQFRVIAAGIRELASAELQASSASFIFGRGGVALRNVMTQTDEALAAAR